MGGVIDHPFFEGLDGDAEGVGRVIRRLALPAHFVLFRQGELADAVYFVVSGRIGVDVRLPGGRISRLATLGPGSVVGELGFMEPNHRRTGTVVILEPTDLLVMLRRDLDALCRHYHPASLTILRRLMDQACAFIERIHGERIPLAQAPRATVPDGGAAMRAAADFDVPHHFRRLAFRVGFTDDELETLLELARPWTCDRGTTLFASGGSNGSIWLVVRGSVELAVDTPGGPRRMAVAGPGQAVVEPGSLTGRPVGLIAVARAGTTLLELSAKIVARLFHPRQRIAYPFCWAMARGLMERVTIDMRALAHEWRAAARGTQRPYSEDPSRSGLFRMVTD